MKSTEWMDSRACGDADPDIFTSPLRTDANEAKRYCKRCPVRLDCLEWAIDTHQPSGSIWGGLGYERRRAFANARNT